MPSLGAEWDPAHYCTSVDAGVARLKAFSQNARYVPLSVKDSENLKGIASGFINDEVGENPVEKDLPAGEIGTAVAAVWDLGQLVKTLKGQ